jgi:hypothetical protein
MSISRLASCTCASALIASTRSVSRSRMPVTALSPSARSWANALKEWKLTCPKVEGKLGLVFPNGLGKVESLVNIINRSLVPPQTAAGVVTPEGKGKYTGMHAHAIIAAVGSGAAFLTGLNIMALMAPEASSTRPKSKPQDQTPAPTAPAHASTSVG